MMSGDAVHERLGAEQHHAALERLADALGDTNRCDTRGTNQAHHVLAVELGERVREHTARAFCRIALAPCATRERPAALEAGPPFRVVEPDAPDERARRALF